MLGMLLSGCLPGYTRINVSTLTTTNQGAPLYMLVRAVDPKAYLTESYQTVASRVIDPDASVLQSAVLYPGQHRTMWLKQPKKLKLAVYFLFTSPSGGSNWRRLFDPVPLRINLALEENQIKPETQR